MKCFGIIIWCVGLFFGIACATPLPVPQEYTEIECVLTPRVRTRAHGTHPFVEANKTNKASASTNWSGYAAATNLSSPGRNTVTAVYGSWIVPSVNSTPINTYASIWVGIDGYRSSTVEQLGTEHDNDNGTISHYAWFEMYPRNSFLINGFSVRQGDVMSASVEYVGSNTFVLKMYNNTLKTMVTIPRVYTVMSGTQRSSAEWIVEAPYLNGILPLSNFGTAYMWGCRATINGRTGLINDTNWSNTAIDMLAIGGVVKAKTQPVALDGGSFFVQWKHQ